MKTKTIIKAEGHNTSLVVSVTLVSNGTLLRCEHDNEKAKTGNAIHQALRNMGYAAHNIHFAKP